MAQPLPIFVLGLQRSGTTWLANLLASHPDVTAVASEDHNGIHESIFFSHFARAFGPWENPENRDRFAEAFRQSDYWILTGLPDDMLVKIITEDARSYADVFRLTMNQVAENRGALAWVEKSPHHSMLANEIAEAIPQARFIMVVRDAKQMALSRLSGFGRTPSRGPKRFLDLARAALVNVLFERRFSELSQDPRYLMVHYDALRKETRQETDRILSFLKLPLTDHDLKSAYAPNSSFAPSTPRPTLNRIDRFVIQLSTGISRLLPIGLLGWLHNARGTARGIDWPDWCWKQSGWSPSAANKTRNA